MRALPRGSRTGRREGKGKGESMDGNAVEREHNAKMRRLGPACAVLLKSDGSFPLPGPGEIAIFGSGARRTVKGGTGSGEVNSREYVTIEQGLENAGFTVTSRVWLDNYDNLMIDARRAFVRQVKERARKHHTLAAFEGMGAVMPEPEYNIPLWGGGEMAIYVLSRISGEGSDRQSIRGDVLLTETEIRDILSLREKYRRFLLVLNVGGVVDLSPVTAVENILLLSQLGAQTGNILADLLLGRSYPSGKLSATWSAWEDYQTVGDFGGRDETCYREGVYVGYRFFDSMGIKPLFPFGFGLGYTCFSVRHGRPEQQDGVISINAAVTNTGARPGRETVQLYVSVPEGRLDQPYQTLAAFQKTRELAPGEKEELTLRFSMRDLASYDSARASWILEKGDYVLRLGTSSVQTAVAGIVRLDKEAVLLKAKNCLGKPSFEDWSPLEPRREKRPRFVKTLRVSASSFERETVDYGQEREIDPFVAALSDEELALLSVGRFDAKAGPLSMIGEASVSVAGAAGETVGEIKGFPSLVMADGPAGLRLARQYRVDEKGVHAVGQTIPSSILEYLDGPAMLALKLLNGGSPSSGELREQNCTAIPIGTALAQSWDPALAEECGDVVGDEMERFGVHLWLAPAMNIQRDIRCGRNFEYFSEDPLLSGKMAAALCRGVQRHPGRAVTIKHFAANNQEFNRGANNSQISNRALREIYLRGFGICVREGAPKALMTSYNLINGRHTSERHGLIEDVLRCEFGFDGLVMTDWLVGMLRGRKEKHAGPDAARIAAAGNDLIMPGSRADVNAILKGLTAKSKRRRLPRRQLEINVTRLYRLAKGLTEAGK